MVLGLLIYDNFIPILIILVFMSFSKLFRAFLEFLYTKLKFEILF